MYVVEGREFRAQIVNAERQNYRTIENKRVKTGYKGTMGFRQVVARIIWIFRKVRV